MGERLRGTAGYVNGFDHSAQMLKRTSSPPPTSYLCRCDGNAVARIAAAPAPGALFAFSAERHDGEGLTFAATALPLLN